MMNSFWFYPLAFLIGSLPFGHWVAKAKGVDITQAGSGNVGATNVGRILGKGPGLFVLFLDVLKGVVPAILASQILGREFGLAPSDHGVLAGLISVFGHMFSPWLGFKGGKGIATGLGMLIGSQPLVGLGAFAVFALVFAPSRLVSLASLVATASILVWGFVLKVSPVTFVVYGLVAFYIFYKHWPNIQRLVRGEEKKFAFGSKGAVDSTVKHDER
ncbi:MAG: glycerol-3-phosphate 1-O-acyltransferase PlsY [Fimbriimonadaceae bacterium]|jgi:glycerol-3-phosphate acyltransferase PlsY|nr:glycerol-3-phosphate 1-O-acyltransferase PlsY [Fimbriimonadaceae bacterium]